MFGRFVFSTQTPTGSETDEVETYDSGLSTPRNQKEIEFEPTDNSRIVQKDGNYEIILGKKIEPKVLNEVLNYMYTEKVIWNKNTDPQYLVKVKEAAEYFQLGRLKQLCLLFLYPDEDIVIPPSKWLNNMKWGFENLRTGLFTKLTFLRS
jgi:hypothetical protein